MGPRQTEHMLYAIREECVEYSDCISLMTSVLFLLPPSDPCLNHIKGAKSAGSSLSLSLCVSGQAEYRLIFNMQYKSHLSFNP